jgi:(1->4)-alpha-D-glucan 1-alpha-D-glucosylmutase
LLAELGPLLDRLDHERTAEREVQDLIDEWTDGRIKLLVTAAGMRFRRQHLALLLNGAYTPLQVEGERADHVVAFARHDDSGALLVVAPRLVVPVVSEERPLPIGPAVWAATRIVLPKVARAAHYRHVFTGERCETPTDRANLPMASALRTCPVALLWAPRREHAVEG